MAKAENTKPFTNKIQSGRKDVIGEGNSIVYSKDKRNSIKRIGKQVGVFTIIFTLHSIKYFPDFQYH